ncbi:MAG: MFS transporter, partial [Anaerolineae bacterium]|nr:MFS transporter [Anaerolineae bacterium]
MGILRGLWRTNSLFFLNVYFFGLSFLWNGLSVILLPAILAPLVPATRKNAYLGLLSSVGLAVAAVAQPLSGHLSDRIRTPWGRRRPWILAGTLGDFACLALLGAAGGVPAIAAGYILLQVTSNIAHGPAFGLIPDLVPPQHRGTAAGAKSLAEMAGLIAGGLVAGHLAEQGHPRAGLAVIGLVLGLCLLGTLAGVREGAPPATAAAQPKGTDRPPLARRLGAAVREAWTEHGDYLWLLAARFVMLVAITPVQGFAQYYVQDFLHVPHPAAATGQLMATTGLSVLVAVYPAGVL